MNIYKYNNFLLENKENFIFVISDKLLKKLIRINSPISKALLDAKGHLSFDISYLDCVSDKEDKISFLPANRYDNVYDGSLSSLYTGKGRQEMSVGKIVNKLFPDKFKQIEIEQFVNDFKTEMKKSSSSFKLVSGEELRYWYLDDNYENKKQGDINSSCMKEAKSQPFLDIYVNNPEKCKLLILMSDKVPDKIKGRALVWAGLRKPENKIYMDRIYTINDSDKGLYIDYAKANNWLYKSKQVMHDASYIDNGKVVTSSVSIALNPAMYKFYPSLDTLPYYTPSTGRLGSNAGNYVSGHPRLNLNSATGGYTKIDR